MESSVGITDCINNSLFDAVIRSAYSLLLKISGDSLRLLNLRKQAVAVHPSLFLPFFTSQRFRTQGSVDWVVDRAS
jgi:hypothetical protein